MLAKIIQHNSNRIISSIRSKNFDWNTTSTNFDIQAIMDALRSNMREITNSVQVKILEEENYYLNYQKNGLRIMEIGLQKGVLYPLHDHPEMIVFSMVVKGKLIFSYADLVEQEKNPYGFRPKFGQE